MAKTSIAKNNIITILAAIIMVIILAAVAYIIMAVFSRTVVMDEVVVTNIQLQNGTQVMYYAYCDKNGGGVITAPNNIQIGNHVYVQHIVTSAFGFPIWTSTKICTDVQQPTERMQNDTIS